MSGLPRAVVKWIQGLDLTFQIDNPKWDFANGFLIAEIFSWYYPNDINMYSFNTGLSLDSKMTNWSLLKKFIIKRDLPIPLELADATMHNREGAAILFIENLYQILTNRPIQKAPPTYQIDLTDWSYQQQLPFHARSTASKSIKNNIRDSELKTDPNMRFTASKVENIIAGHVEHRKEERDEHPGRFNVRKTLAERCVQRPVPEAPKSSSQTDTLDYYSANHDMSILKTMPSTGQGSGAFINGTQTESNAFKEIKVNQEAYSINMAATA